MFTLYLASHMLLCAVLFLLGCAKRLLCSQHKVSLPVYLALLHVENVIMSHAGYDCNLVS